ncbi:MAG: cation:dicarboxylate symporter family transporter, partial [Brevinema sp.]
AILVGTAVGVPMNADFFIMVVVVAVLGSLGIAGIPGAATMAASIMLSGIGLSQHFGLLAIVLAIDPIIDMARTMINVAGAMVSAVCVDKELGSLNEKVYNDMSASIVEE